MSIIDRYISTRKELFQYFGFDRRLVPMPIEESLEYYWYTDKEEMKLYLISAESIRHIVESYAVGGQRCKKIFESLDGKYSLIATRHYFFNTTILRILDNTKKRELP